MFQCNDFLKQRLGVDDSLDVFPVHGVGGALGTILVAVFASSTLGVFSGQGDGLAMLDQFSIQVLGVIATGGYTAVLTFALLKFVDLAIGLRVSDEERKCRAWISINIMNEVTTINRSKDFHFLLPFHGDQMLC